MVVSLHYNLNALQLHYNLKALQLQTHLERKQMIVPNMMSAYTKESYMSMEALC
jgi:hypothetical protein